MGQSGTTPPAGWSVFQLPGAAGNWNPSAGIPASEVGGGTASTGLTAALNPTANNVNGYNAATAGNPTDRTIATAPTGVNGIAIQLQLTNATGVALNAVNIQYDIRRFTVGSQQPEELPGFWLFHSLDNGATWTNVTALNPVVTGSAPQVVVPNTVGVTTVPRTSFILPVPWNNGANILFRWIDDNADVTSPDQIIGLDNVVVAPIPEPSVLLLTALGGLGLVARVRRSVWSRGSKQAAT
jgi:hypothetical protein